MVNVISPQPFVPAAPIKTPPAQTAAGAGGEAAPARDKTGTKTGDKTGDTVTLSNDGHKLVNLGRGKDLAQDIRNAPVDASFADKLKSASADISRITRLFSETVRSIFKFWR